MKVAKVFFALIFGAVFLITLFKVLFFMLFFGLIFGGWIMAFKSRSYRYQAAYASHQAPPQSFAPWNRYEASVQPLDPSWSAYNTPVTAAKRIEVL